MNAIVKMGVDMMNAVSALRLKRHRLIGTSDGVVIQQLGKPDLLITPEAARRFAQEIEEQRCD